MAVVALVTFVANGPRSAADNDLGYLQKGTGHPRCGATPVAARWSRCYGGRPYIVQEALLE